MKKFCTVFLCAFAFVLTICAVPRQAQAAIVKNGTCGENLTWVLDDTGKLTISGTGPMKDYDYWSCPSWSDVKNSIKIVTIQSGVTTIGDCAFYSCTSLTTVTIGDSVTTIGDGAFSDCDNLTSVNISDSVTTIGWGAFSDCDGLTEMIIPDSVVSMDESVFEYCDGLISVIIGNGVTTIGDWAFYSCTSLEAITIPDSVTTIGDAAFAYCNSLTSVTIPANVTTIGNEAFGECDSLMGIWVDYDNPNFSSDAAGVLFNKDKSTLIQAPGGISGNYTVLDCVTTISNWAFYDCAGLTAIWVEKDNPNYSSDDYGVLFNKDKTKILVFPSGLTGSYIIPDSVTELGVWFGEGNSLTSLTIHKGVTGELDVWSFYDCGKLESIWIDAEHPDYSSDASGVVYNKDKTRLIFAPRGLSGVYTVPDSVTKTEWFAFYDCDKLTEVRLPSSLSAMVRGLFCDCDSLVNIVIPEGVKELHGDAIINCINLKTVTIPASVTEIDPHAFYGCSGLTQICVDADNPNYCSDQAGVLYNKDKTKLIVAPGGISGTYAIPEGVTKLEEEAFVNCYDLQAVSLPNTVTQIAYETFGNCYSLTAIGIPESVVVIDRAFGDCDALTDIYYGGTQEQWERVDISEYWNEAIARATVHFQSQLPMNPGDMDGNETTNVDDAIYLLQHVLMPDMFAVTKSADVDKNGTVNVDDAIYLLQHVLMPDLFPL